MKKNKRKQKSSERSSASRMDAQKIQTVIEWLARMEIHLEKAIALSERIGPNEFDEETDFFWALVKYAENVQECVTQLDKVNNSVFPCLIEIPSNPSPNDDLSWDGLKGMRIRLAHKFWSIDPDILWNTVKRDFPVLLAFLKTLFVSPQIDYARAIVDTKRFLALSPVNDGDKLEFGTLSHCSILTRMVTPNVFVLEENPIGNWSSRIQRKDSIVWVFGEGEDKSGVLS